MAIESCRLGSWRTTTCTMTLALLACPVPSRASEIAFNEAPRFAVGAAPVDIASGEFTHGGGPDLIVATSGVNGVTLLSSSSPRGDQYARFDIGDVGGPPGSIAVGDFDRDGWLDFVVTSIGINTVSVMRNLLSGSSFGRTTYYAGPGAARVRTADLNGDGALDIVVKNSTATVSVLMNNGDGTFAHRVPYGIGGVAQDLVVERFRGAPSPDLAALTLPTLPCNCSGDSVRVALLLNTGTGSFGPAVQYGVASPAQLNVGYAVAALDFNLDSKPDLAIATGRVLQLLANQGAGSFATSLPIVQVPLLSNSGDPRGLVRGDFDRNGRADLAVTNSLSNDVSFLTDHWDFETFDRADYGAGWKPAALIAVDLNADGVDDIATADSGGNSVSVLLSRFDLARRARVDFPTRGAGLALGDINEDGRSEVVTIASFPSLMSILVYENLGNGVLSSTERSFATSLQNYTAPLACADLDSDGHLDVVAVGQTPAGYPMAVSILYGVGPPALFSGATLNASGSGDYIRDMKLVDADRDGRLDILLAGGSNVSVLHNETQRTFVPTIYSLGAAAATLVALASGDLDGDGDSDIATTSSYFNGLPGKICLLRRESGGGYAQTGVIQTISDPGCLLLEDLNDDGLGDIAVARWMYSSQNGVLALHFHLSDNTFSAGQLLQIGGTAGGTVAWLGLEDIDLDGMRDLVVGKSSGAVAILRQTGPGQYAQPIEFFTAGGSGYAVGDVDGDPFPDIVAVNGETASLLRNRTGISTSVSELTPASARTLLLQNEPNPFNPTTRLPFVLSQKSHVRLGVYDVRGRLVRVLADDVLPSGLHALQWQGNFDAGVAAPSGVYWYRLTVDGKDQARKMVLIR